MQIDRVEVRGRFAEFRLSGEVSLSALMQSLREVLAECLRRELTGALVDLRGASGTLDAFERAELVTMLAPQWPREVLLATVLNDELFLPSRFGQLLAQNRGVRVREFLSCDEAAAWLSSALVDPPSDTPLDPF